VRTRRWSRIQPLSELNIHVAVSEAGVCRLALNRTDAAFLRDLRHFFPDPVWRRDDGGPLLDEADRQINGYFAGQLRTFELPLDLNGTDFQKRVWRTLLEIPYGQTRTYQEIARRIHAPAAVRAVGAANGRNPVPVIVPCHRVIAADGGLQGFAAGIPLKKLLLGIEASHSGRGRAGGQLALPGFRG